MSGFSQFTAGNLPALATNTAATAGKIGEIIRGDLASGSATSLATSTTKNITSISLTAGNWCLYGAVLYTLATTTNVTQIGSVISLTTATTNNIDSLGNDFRYFPAFAPGNIIMNTNMAGSLVSISSTTSYFLNARAIFTVSTMTAYGSLVAVRFA